MSDKPKVILIVEDELFIRESLSLRLKQEDFKVHEAENGAKGYEMAIKLRPDIILLDIIMPEMDGLTAMGKIRSENEYGKKVPIIIMTNLPPDSDVLDKIVQYTPSYYFIKSKVKTEGVIEKIKDILGSD